MQQQLSEPVDMASNSESISSSQASDVLMIRPFLDYINGILMEEGMDDATCMEQVDHVSYQAIFSGFHDIVGEHFPPISCADSTSDGDVFDPHQQRMYCYHEKDPDEQHVKVVDPNDGYYSITNGSRISLPAKGHPQSSFQQERVIVGFTLKPGSGFQGHLMASHTPLKSTQITELHEMKNDMHNSGSRLNEASVSLSSKIDTMAQINIKLNDGVPIDMMVPCWGKGAVVKGLCGHRCMGGLELGYSNLKLPSVDEELSSKLAQVDLSFNDLKLKAVYTDLYAGATLSKNALPSSLGSSTRGAGDIKHHEVKKKSGKKRTSEVQVFVDLKEVLVGCAQAVAIGDATRANKILEELHQIHHASVNGTGLQRTAHFFSEALAARLRGMGEQHFREISHNVPSAATLLRDSKVGFGETPYMKVLHYFANQSILKVAEGASRLHIVDYGFLYGMQWPCLINALADRKGGPPLLIITGIEYPQPGINLMERLEESGRRLAAYAKTYGVPFQYHTVVTNKWEDLDVSSLHLHEGEILVVNSIKGLNHLADESADLALTISPRQKFLASMHMLNPHLLVTAVMNAAYNSTFFVTRFREALYYYSNLFDMLDIMSDDTPQRLIMERSCLYRDIVNIVACEGTERVERPETYKQWHGRITKTGFEQLPIPPTILSRSRSYLKQHDHKDFLIHDDANGWMLLGWKGRVMVAISAWKPSLV